MGEPDVGSRSTDASLTDASTSAAYDTPDGTDPATTAALVQRLGEQVSSLVRDEVALAKVEVTEAAKRAGIGAGLLGTAGLMAHFGAGVLLAAVVLALALAMPAWLAALIVAAALFAVAAAAGLLGRRRVATASEPLDTTVRNVQADSHAVTSGGSS